MSDVATMLRSAPACRRALAALLLAATLPLLADGSIGDSHVFNDAHSGPAYAVEPVAVAELDADLLAAQQIEYADAGVSGGVWGLENGYCIMFGGSDAAAARLRPYMEALAPTPATGWLHAGPVGSGHFVKMVHNGIEYGMMQAFAEGFALMKNKPGFDLDIGEIAELWRHGSVVRSWLLDLSADFLAQDQTLESVEPFVADSGEGRWTVLESVEQGIPAPVMSLALMMRFASQGRMDLSTRPRSSLSFSDVDRELLQTLDKIFEQREFRPGKMIEEKGGDCYFCGLKQNCESILNCRGGMQ